MVGVDGSSPFAPTKIGRESKHLAETLGAFFLSKPKSTKNAESSVNASALLEDVIPGRARRILRAARNRNPSSEEDTALGFTTGILTLPVYRFL